MKELLITTNVPAQIGANFDDVKAELSNMMKAYAGLEVTEENIPERKKDVATLRKIKKAVNDKRKEVKKEFEKPLKAFESRCKELTDLIDTEIDHINTGLDAFEAARVAEKQAKIQKLYDENIAGYAEFLPLEKVFDRKWLNKTCPDKEIIADIQQARITVGHDLQVLKTASSEYYDECVEVYKCSGLTMAMQRLNDLRTARERAEADLRADLKSAGEVRKESAKEAESPEIGAKTYTFRVLTEQDRDSTRAYLEMMGIEYRYSEE